MTRSDCRQYIDMKFNVKQMNGDWIIPSCIVQNIKDLFKEVSDLVSVQIKRELK